MFHDHAIAHATFIVSCDYAPPETWTQYFGIPPSRVISKGERYFLPSGRLSDRPGKLNLWALESKSSIQSDNLEPHLRYLIRCLSLPRADLRERAEYFGARMRLLCYWDNEAGDRVPDVPQDICRLCESQGINIDIDEYR